jgi:hypothetical protein
MTKSILALSIGAAVLFGAQANIISSDTTESSGYNKAIEIANTDTETVPLTFAAAMHSVMSVPYFSGTTD